MAQGKGANCYFCEYCHYEFEFGIATFWCKAKQGKKIGTSPSDISADEVPRYAPVPEWCPYIHLKPLEAKMKEPYWKFNK